MARKVYAVFSDGSRMERTTTLGLTHAWRWKGRRGFGDQAVVGGSGFASSRELAARAVASDSAWVVRRSKFDRHIKDWKPGAIDATEIVEVTEAV